MLVVCLAVCSLYLPSALLHFVSSQFFVFMYNLVCMYMYLNSNQVGMQHLDNSYAEELSPSISAYYFSVGKRGIITCSFGVKKNTSLPWKFVSKLA